MNSTTTALATRPAIDPRNPPTVYEWNGPTGVHFRDVREPSGTYYHDTTPRAVIDALERVMGTDATVRVWYGDRETGKNWYQEYNVCGRIGRSTGWLKIALLCHPRSRGGAPLLADCIVCLFVNGREVYRHPGFKMPTIHLYHEGTYPTSPWAADVDGDKGFAWFKSELAANRWAAFMCGKRMAK